MSTVYVVTSATGFLDWDDRGAMSTGEAMWGGLPRARKYNTHAEAVKVATDVRRAYRVNTWVYEVILSLGEKTDVSLPEDDPEYAEYLRLQKKFK